MTPSAFSYARPASLTETIALVSEHTTDARILAGGQSLIPLLAQRSLRPRLVIDITRLAGLDRIELQSDHVRMGALVRQEQARLSPVVRADVPALAAALNWVASPVIRERGTVIGNLALNAPGTELPAVAIALGATFVVRDATGERLVAAMDLLGPDRRLDSGSMITHMLWPRATGPGAFYEVARRDGHAPVVGAMAQLNRDQCRIGLCGVAAVGTACHALAREVFVRQPGVPDLAEIDTLLDQDLAGLNASASRLGDAFVDAEYRREVAPIVIQRALDAMRRDRGALS